MKQKIEAIDPGGRIEKLFCLAENEKEKKPQYRHWRSREN